MFKIAGLFVMYRSTTDSQVAKLTITINKDTGLIVGIESGIKPDALHFVGCLIFPGFIDLHVHCRQDVSGKDSYKEDFSSVSAAAINGGVTLLCDMPNNPIAPIDDERYHAKKQLTEQSQVPIILYAGIGPGTRPLRTHVPYKAYMGHSVGDLFFSSFEEMAEVIPYYYNKDVSCHCDDQEILDLHKTASTHERRRPAESEMSGIDQALYFAEKFNLHLKLCHCSICGGLPKILAAKRRGIDVTCEVTPHHLYFDEEILTLQNRPWFQMNPPLRTRIDRLHLIDALRRGDIDYLATDHAPHTEAEKQKGISGVPLLDTYGAFTMWLMDTHKFKPEDIARVCSYNPGKFVKKFLDPSFGAGVGRIEVGYTASFTILNTIPFTVRKENLRTKCNWSPFEGHPFSGGVEATIVRGNLHIHTIR